jgi:NADH pyrophosphatase NudC (nudix superfamily)
VGKIYVLANASIRGVKIGATRGSAKRRARQLASTGVPTPFRVVHEREVPDPWLVERAVHSALESVRINSRREFFDCSPAHAIATIERVCAQLGLSTPNSGEHRCSVCGNVFHASEQAFYLTCPKCHEVVLNRRAPIII